MQRGQEGIAHRTKVKTEENIDLGRGRNLYVLTDLISLRRGRAFAAKNGGKVEVQMMTQPLKEAMMGIGRRCQHS